MKIVGYMATVILLMGCTPAPEAKSVSVGMPVDRAEAALKSAGARQVQMDGRDQTETDVFRSYDLVDGSVLVVTASKSEQKVSRLEVCRNADQPKSHRTWVSVESVTLTADRIPSAVANTRNRGQ